MYVVVKNVPEAPTLTSASFDVDENVDYGYHVGSLADYTSEPDFYSTCTYYLSSSQEVSQFAR